MNTSLQAARGRHLAPATSDAPFRVLIWERRSLLDIWVLAQVFEMATFDEAEAEALDTCTEPYPDGVTAMHYVSGECFVDEPERDEADHQAWQNDHARDQRKHAS